MTCTNAQCIILILPLSVFIVLCIDQFNIRQTKVKAKLQAFSLWFWLWCHEKYAHCLCSHTPPVDSKPDEQVPDCSVSKQAAPTAEWVEARGERSHGLACIPHLQLSLLFSPTFPCEPLLLLRFVIFRSGCMAGRVDGLLSFELSNSGSI